MQNCICIYCLLSSNHIHFTHHYQLSVHTNNQYSNDNGFENNLDMELAFNPSNRLICNHLDICNQNKKETSLGHTRMCRAIEAVEVFIIVINQK